MKKKLVTFIIALSVSVSSVVGLNSMQAKALPYDSVIDLIGIASEVLELIGIPNIKEALYKADINDGRASQYVGYIPTKFEDGKFYISAYETNNPTYKSDIYYIRVYNKNDPFNFKEYNLQSNEQVGITTPDDGSEKMIEVYTYRGEERSRLVTFLLDEAYKNKNYGMALSRRYHESSNFYFLEKINGIKYDGLMLSKYTAYNFGNPSLTKSEESYYNDIPSDSPGREYCIRKAKEYRGVSLKEDNIKFNESKNQKMMQQWRNDHLDKLSKENVSFAEDMLQISADRKSSDAKKAPFEVEITNVFGTRNYELRENEKLDLVQLLSGENSIVKFYQKDSDNNRTEIDSLFISKEFVRNRNFGVKLISTTDKPEIYYLNKTDEGVKIVDRNEMVDKSLLNYDPRTAYNGQLEAHNMISDWNAKRYSFWNDKYSIYASSEELEQSNEPVKNLVDGDDSTTWCTKWDKSDKNNKHVTVALDKNSNWMNFFTYTPRDDQSLNGTITKYKISVSDDGVNFREIASGDWELNKNMKRVDFAPVSAAYVRLEVVDAYGGWASGSEILFGMERREG